jgi:hypothetical protein
MKLFVFAGDCFFDSGVQIVKNAAGSFVEDAAD